MPELLVAIYWNAFQGQNIQAGQAAPAPEEEKKASN